MSRPKTNEFDTSLMEVEISQGIDNFMSKHGFKTDYQCGKACDLNDNAFNNMRKSGGISAISLYKLGLGVGYKARKGKSNMSVIVKVLKDFEGE